MAVQNAPASENFGSAQDLMNEALEKASVELDKTVKACIEQLNTFNQTLAKNLAVQLQKLIEQSQSFVDSNIEDLASHREELIDRLVEFERTEIGTMSSAARDVRQQISERAEAAGEAIAKLVEEQMAELRSHIENPEKRFANFTAGSSEALEILTTGGKAKIEAEESDLEKSLTQKAQDLEQSVKEVISDSKKSIENTLEKHNQAMESKIGSIVEQLTEVVNSTITECNMNSGSGQKNLDLAADEGKQRLASNLTQWKKDCQNLNQSFQDFLNAEASDSEESHTNRLEHKVNEVKDEITSIAQDANTKIVASHKLFFSSLKRLEKKYNDRLERLLAKFESALAQESKIPQASVQSPHELRELLHARLQSRGKEIIKALQRQVEQIESEYTRYTSGSSERLEGIRAASTESLDKQLRIMKSELDRISRSFNTELSQLNADLPQIEEAGLAAAMAVTAYRDARLSFGSE
jgi:hypothetical protein